MSDTVRTSHAGRTWLASILIVLGVVMTPIAVLTNWATVQVSNQAQFVNSLAPLASNPAVQNSVINTVTKSINDAIDIPAVTNSLLGGLGTALNLPEPAKKALGLVSDPIAAGVQGLVHDVVTKAVQSEAFQKGWTQALTLTQTQVVDLLSNNGKSALALGNDGTLTLPLKPIIEQVKADLVAQKVAFANLIPVIDTSITIAKIPELVVVRTVYQIGVGVGTWLPWIVLALFAGGVLVAYRRARALMAVGISTVVISGVIAIALPVIRVVATNAVDSTFAPAVTAVFDAIVAYMVVMLSGLAVLGVVLALAGWWMGISSSAVRTRAFFGQQIAAVRGVIAPRSTGYAASVARVYQWRWVIRGMVVALIGWWMGSIQPLNPTSVILLSLLAVVLLVAFEMLTSPLRGAVAAPAAQAAQAVAAKPVAVAKPAAKKPAAKSASTTTAKAAAKKPAPRKPSAK